MTDKNQLRQYAKNIRDNIPVEKRAHGALMLADNINQVLENFDGGLVATYYPFGSEIHPPHELEKFDTALPIIRDKKTLEFYKWKKGEELIHGRFDIPIPKRHSASPDRPDIILLPLLLCDIHGNRIGYGAGHYDQYITACSIRPYLIGVCFNEQVYDGEIPAEDHDQRLDLIITPKRIIKAS